MISNLQVCKTAASWPKNRLTRYSAGWFLVIEKGCSQSFSPFEPWQERICASSTSAKLVVASDETRCSTLGYKHWRCSSICNRLRKGQSFKEFLDGALTWHQDFDFYEEPIVPKKTLRSSSSSQLRLTCWSDYFFGAVNRLYRSMTDINRESRPLLWWQLLNQFLNTLTHPWKTQKKVKEIKKRLFAKHRSCIH